MNRISMWKAVIAVVVALAFVLPGAAAFANVGTIGVTSGSKNAVDINSNNVVGIIMSDTPREDTLVAEKTGNHLMPLASTIYVDDDAAPGWYDVTHVHTITQGVTAAIAGDTVYVYNGTYSGPVNVTKQVNLVGENRENVIVNGSGTGNVFYITTPVTKVNISTVSITNGQYGIYIYKSSYNNITNCNVYKNTGSGIYIFTTSSYNRITNCNVYNNTNYGIYIYSSSNYNVITNCNVYNNPSYGIYIATCSNNKLRGNTIHDNAYNFGVDGTAVSYFTQDIDPSNTINGKPIYYLTGLSNIILNETKNVGYLGLVSCTNITLKNSDVNGILMINTIKSTISNVSSHNSGNGIYLWNSNYMISSYNNITNCSVYNNKVYGIYLCGTSTYTTSSHNRITNCNVYNNTGTTGGTTAVTGTGIYLVYANNNSIMNCNVHNNKLYGIYLNGASYNTITNCDVCNNKYGIVCWWSPHSKLRGNTIHDNLQNFGILGTVLADFTYDIDLSNTLNGRHMYYLVNQQNMILNEDNNFGYLGLISCTNITAKNADVNGIVVVNTAYSTISNVNSHNGTNSIYVGVGSHNNNFINCTAYNNPSNGISLQVSASNNNFMNCSVHDNVNYGIWLSGSSNNNNFTNCNTYNNKYGIDIYSTSNNNKFMNCNAYNNTNSGIYFFSTSNNNIITNCNVYNNKYGIYFHVTSNTNIITDCNVYNNQYGIYLETSSNNNLIRHNNFIANTVNAYDACSNKWNDSYPSGGNYWSNYTGVDNYNGPGQNISGSDGIGDTSYNIPGKTPPNKDWYPRMVPLDATPPIITKVKATPESQGQSAPVNITCTVIDFIMVDTVKVNISGPGGFVLEARMNKSSSYYHSAVYTTMGVYHYYIWANDTSGNIAVSGTHSFVITDLDIPTSSVNPLSLWKKAVPFTITATAHDNTMVENVTLYYRHSSNGTAWTNWTSYGTDIATPWSWSFTGAEGHYQFYSIAVDNSGNREDPPGVADASTGIDTVAPVTTIELAGTMGGNNWYKGIVTVTLSATDTLSGIESTWYQKDMGYWTIYTVPFTVSGDGQHIIQYHSLDHAGNLEIATSVSFKIDTIAPTTTYALQGLHGSQGWYIINVTVTLSASDATSGVNYTEYKLNTGDWIVYNGSFVVTENGNYTLYYHSVDLAGNTEAIKQAVFKIQHDVTPPVTTHHLDGTMGENNWFISTVTVTLSAEDDSAGVATTKYKLDAGAWMTYTTTFPVTGDTVHTLYYYSVDKVGNREEDKSATFKIDRTKPMISLAVEKTGLMKYLLTATVSDETSGIAKVDFYVDSEFVGEDAEAPYELEYSGTGDTAQAIVYDNAGNSAISAEVKDQAAPDSQSQSSMLTLVSVSKDTIQGQSISSTLQRLFNLR